MHDIDGYRGRDVARADARGVRPCLAFLAGSAARAVPWRSWPYPRGLFGLVFPLVGPGGDRWSKRPLCWSIFSCGSLGWGHL